MLFVIENYLSERVFTKWVDWSGSIVPTRRRLVGVFKNTGRQLIAYLSRDGYLVLRVEDSQGLLAVARSVHALFATVADWERAQHWADHYIRNFERVEFGTPSRKEVKIL